MRMCSWVIGDPATRFGYCQEPAVHGRSFCAHHLQIVYPSPDDDRYQHQMAVQDYCANNVGKGNAFYIAPEFEDMQENA